MRYVFGTKAVTAFVKHHPASWARPCQTRIEDVYLSAIVAHEVFYGAFSRTMHDQTLAQIDDLPFEIPAFDASDARKAGEIRAALADAGTPIGPYDVLIAG